MNNPNSSSLAFPIVDKYLSLEEYGLTKREYFAALAMQGMISKGWTSSEAAEVGKRSILFADELLKALEQ